MKIGSPRGPLSLSSVTCYDPELDLICYYLAVVEKPPIVLPTPLDQLADVGGELTRSREECQN